MVRDIIQAFPEDQRHKLTDSIVILAEQGNSSGVTNVIQAFPEKDRVALAKIAIGLYVDKGHSKLVDNFCRTINLSEKEELKIMKELIEERGYHPALGKKLPMLDWGSAVLNEFTKAIVGGLSNVGPDETPSVKLPKPKKDIAR